MTKDLTASAFNDALVKDNQGYSCRYLLWLTLKREILLSYRKRSESIYPVLFFLIIVTFFPLATTPDPRWLTVMGPGVIWVAALLASVLSLTHLFRDDYLDGSLEALLLTEYSLPWLMFCKLTAQWLISMLPLIVISPVIALWFHLSAASIGILMVSLLLGTPILTLLGGIGAALTVGLRNGSLLSLLLLLPLYVPTLIFASNAVRLANLGGHVNGPFAWLAAILLLSLMLTPWVTGFALKMGIAYD